MQRSWPRTRLIHTAAGLLLVVAVGLRLVSANLPSGAVVVEAGLLAVGFVYAAVAISLRHSEWGQTAAAQLVLSAGGIAISTAVLAVAGPWLPDLAPLSIAITCAFFLTVDPMQTRRLQGAVVVMGTAGLMVLWAEALLVLHRPPVELAVYAVLLASIVLLVYVTLQMVTDRLQAEVQRTEAIANAAQRVGLATDLAEVARAVLEASVQSYPAADQGGVLLYDAVQDLLIALPISLVGGEVGLAPNADIRIRPGQALAGNVFLTGEARCWETIDDIVVEHDAMNPMTREQIRQLVGTVKSGVVAPLQVPDRGVIGVLTLGSTLSEHVWRPADLLVVQGLAEQAALGVERARLYQEQRTQALTDHLTGLANNRQLRASLTQEVARATRNSTSLAVLFCDLDAFKAVNDRHGHAAGDLVLKLFADTLGNTLRSEDVAARYGGDEFVCVLPGADADRANLVAARLHARFAERLGASPALAGVETAVSSGVAVFPLDGDNPETLLAIADAALMGSKSAAEASSNLG